MNNDTAIFLDLDNLVIGAKQANLTFDINLILEHIKTMTDNGRIVLRRSYGDWRQSQQQLKELTTAGFTNQSNVRLNNFSKNLADMQIVVDAMDTLVDGNHYKTYVLITGDRDFTPLAQSLRKRGKRVIGVGVKHATSKSFAALCDEYVYYEELVPKLTMTPTAIEELLTQALDELLGKEDRVRTSVLMERMKSLSRDAFGKENYQGNFSKFLSQYPTLLDLQQDGTTVYVRRPKAEKKAPLRPLHLRYRSYLKRQRLRIVPAKSRVLILKDIIARLQNDSDWKWRPLLAGLAETYAKNGRDISKNAINDVMLAARRGQVVQTLKGRTLATAPVYLNLKGDKLVQEALVRCDAVYLHEILNADAPFEIEEAAIALYDDPQRAPYLEMVMKKWMGHVEK